MKILVLNSGSSSIKYQLFEMPSETVICSGLVERIGLPMGKLYYDTEKGAHEEEFEIANHKIGLKRVLELLMDTHIGVISSTNDIKAVGHRVVHGGSKYDETAIVDDHVKKEIKELFSLAPLHNPANLEGIEVSESIFTSALLIAVFDTAFHQSIPEKAHKYAIPNELYENEHVRLYGFHGTSHKYVSEKAIQHLSKETSKVISIHLGNGCSITAIKDGKSIDHSLGFGPVTGLIMGTRSGTIDHEIIFYLVNELGYALDDVKTMLQKKSGMLGLTGYSDLRDIETKANEGDNTCLLALEMNAYRIKKFIGAYAASLNGLDAIVFTAGIGENSSLMRALICRDMEFFGIKLNADKNNERSKALREIQTDDSGVKILVIPTNEELEIARQSFQLLDK